MSAEAVGAAAGRQLGEDLASGACVDHWLADQLVVFMALAAGRSALLCGEPSLHTRTALAVAEQVPVACARHASLCLCLPGCCQHAVAGAWCLCYQTCAHRQATPGADPAPGPATAHICRSPGFGR